MPMRTKITVKGGFVNIKAKLTKESDVNRLRAVMEEAGKKAVEELKAASPKDTGEYAEGWSASVESASKDQIEVSVTNNSHPEYPNLPLALNYGHGTGTGGYVPGDNHITSTMERIKPEIEKMIGDEFNE